MNIFMLVVSDMVKFILAKIKKENQKRTLTQDKYVVQIEN